MSSQRLLAALACAAVVSAESVVRFDSLPGVTAGPTAPLAAAQNNTRILNAALKAAAAAPGGGDGVRLLFPANATFVLMGGVVAQNLTGFTFDVQGRLLFTDADLEAWPRDGKTPLPALAFLGCSRLLVTGGFDEVAARVAANLSRFLDPAVPSPPYAWDAAAGVIDGLGDKWWGIPLVGYAVRGEHRPRLLYIGQNSTDVVVERVYLRNSAYWTLYAEHAARVEVRYVLLTAMRNDDEWMKAHSLIALTAFNTDGFDFSHTAGVHVHDCEVWNQDDSVAVKDAVSDVVVERVSASGLGLTIGSIGASTVRNVTFRQCAMRETVKGIYMKFRDAGAAGGTIEDVLYEDVRVRGVSGWPVWIGPAQQSDSVDLCAAHPCSICWPDDPFAKCNTGYQGLYRNVTLRRVRVGGERALGHAAPGVLMGADSRAMEGLVLDSVVVERKAEGGDAAAADVPWFEKAEYKCVNVKGVVVTGDTDPKPVCQ